MIFYRLTQKYGTENDSGIISYMSYKIIDLKQRCNYKTLYLQRLSQHIFFTAFTTILIHLLKRNSIWCFSNFSILQIRILSLKLTPCSINILLCIHFVEILRYVEIQFNILSTFWKWLGIVKLNFYTLMKNKVEKIFALQGLKLKTYTHAHLMSTR